MLPIVAIIGRPNVGKSTLFNRIIRRRLAIVDNKPGITRDRHYAEADWNGKGFVLVDTGGLIPDTKTELEQEVYLQAQIAINEAEVIIFLLDVKSGITYWDDLITKHLRQSKKNIILVINKVDSEKDEADVYSFWNLGLDEPYPVSATQGRGIGELLDVIVDSLPEEIIYPEYKEHIPIAVIGRPNVGKSSLVNKLLGEEKVIVSEIPGTTRDSIDTPLEWQGDKFVLIDTAGLRRRYKVNENIEYYSYLRTLKSLNRSEIALLLLDATAGITIGDQKIADYIEKAYRSVIIIINKWDLVEKDQKTYKTFEELIEWKLPFLTYAPHLFISAKTGRRITKILEKVKEVQQERIKRIPTSRLNIFLQQVTKHYAPFSKGRHTIRMYYVTQAEISPPTFIFFCNYPEELPKNYIRYLKNQLRYHFGFIGTPLKLAFRARREDNG